ncbi:MAG: DUF1007 family protein [Candidatus Zixiibacteriota bacterium]
MKMRIAQLFIIFFLIGFAFSHPHVFIDVECEIVVDDNNLKGFDIKWVFDKMYSYDILTYLTDGNSDIDATEKAELERNFIETFGLTTFNTHVIIGDSDFHQQEILSFDAELTEKRQMVFTFHFPYYKALQDGPFEFMLSFYDETLYYAYTPIKTPEIKGSDNIKCDINKKNDVTYTIKLNKK